MLPKFLPQCLILGGIQIKAVRFSLFLKHINFILKMLIGKGLSVTMRLKIWGLSLKGAHREIVVVKFSI